MGTAAPAIRSLYKRDEIPSSGPRTLQNLVSLKGRPLSIVNESKLNHKGPLRSGQIFQLEVKSYLRLTGCDGRKWYVDVRGDNSGDSSSFAAKLSPCCTGGGKP